MIGKIKVFLCTAAAVLLFLSIHVEGGAGALRAITVANSNEGTISNVQSLAMEENDGSKSDRLLSRSDDHCALRHVVAFKFKDSASPAEVKKVEKAFRALKSKIPLIANLEAGTNNSPENLNKGFTHIWILSFNSENDRDEYLVHPIHLKFVDELVKPYVDESFVIDFCAK